MTVGDTPPTMGRIVHYRSRTGNYSCAAVVTATPADLHQPNVDAGFIAGITDDGRNRVHLLVLSPGKLGKRATAGDFVGERKDAPIAENTGGTYAEWDVPLGGEDEPGTWYWPLRVG